MAELTLIVREAPEGWFVEDGTTAGPFVSKEQAVNLAEGMASAMSRTGQLTNIVVYRMTPSRAAEA